MCGVTRLGYGNAEGKRGGDAVKEIIGDAIRNAGMRFGMALDLWTSSDLEIAENGPKDGPVRPEATPEGQASATIPPPQTRPVAAAVPDPPQQQRPGAMPPAGPNERQTALDAMLDAARAANFADGLPAQFADAFGHPIEQGTAAEFRQAAELMRGSVAA